MINKFKNIFKSNSPKDTEIAKSKIRDIDIEELVISHVEEHDKKVEGVEKTESSEEKDSDAHNVTVFNEVKEKKAKSKIEMPKAEMSKHGVYEFPRGNKGGTVPMSSYALDELIGTSVKQFAPIIIKKGIRLELDGVDITIKTNKEVMLFILQEVISNALNHMVVGELKIYVLNEELLIIEDNGAGIPASELPKVFQEGYVGEKAINKDTAEGIGLFKSAIALEKMAYPYEIQSAEGIGTAFAIKVK